MEQKRKILWEPSSSFRRNSHLSQYMDWLGEEKNLDFGNYQELWKWSVDHISDFWESIIQYFNLSIEGNYSHIVTGEMPNCKWLEGSKVNYAEHLFRRSEDEREAVIFYNEEGQQPSLSWKDLKSKAAAFRSYLISKGVKKGDRVVAYLPNTPEAVIAFIGTSSLGAIWSSCSPDFGVSSVIDRFQQIEPKILITVDGYRYNGKHFDRLNESQAIASQLTTLKEVVVVPYIGGEIPVGMKSWNEVINEEAGELEFDRVEFNDPLWILYSSGTTGIPKAITQSHGGILLEHIKYMSFHNDVKEGEKFFWFTTTGWMMWNYQVGALLSGATIVLYDGSPGFPDLNILWRMADEIGLHHFGTSAPYILACRKRDLDFSDLGLKELRSIGSTGSPLPTEGFEFVYGSIKKDVWLCSMAGGTDVCTAFIGGNPLLPVRCPEIQCIALGVSLRAYDEDGHAITDDLGEMVIEKPMPSMPIYFWNDPGGNRYHASYFEMFPGIWRHGDWIKITEDGSLIIYGRSDATLNRQGIRIGTSEIYSSVRKVSAIEDSVIVNLELEGGKHFMPLFVKISKGAKLDDHIIQKLKSTLREDYTPRHVPDVILEIPDIPYTISGKKLEAPIKKILMGMPISQAANKEAMKNPDAIDYFIENKEDILAMAD
ncbi:MAG: acetoacetate--CoA ligase [Saprospiraceae bacterium]|nr:acetoacetate--CoA ligase [Saprospiraceae bacterium]